MISGEYITSRQNPHVVRICKLSDKKKRNEEGLFRFDGIKLFSEAAESGVEFEYLLVKKSAKDRISTVVDKVLAGEKRLSFGRVLILEDSVFDKISEEKSPEGIICVAKHIDKLRKIATINIARKNSDGCDGGEITPEEKIILLESVRDAGNLGTIFRSALAFGIDRLIISSDCADVYNSKTVRASMGAVFRLRVDIVDDIREAVSALRKSGRRVFAAALERDAMKLGSFEVGKSDCIVIGNEGHGLSKEIIDECDSSVFIPISEQSESLNAAIAASVCMWEITR